MVEERVDPERSVQIGLRGMNIIGADIVCMVPARDTEAKITGMTAQAIMFAFIALISDYLNGR